MLIFNGPDEDWDLSLSPRDNENYESISCFTSEGKKTDYNKSLKYQLFANTVLTSVIGFVEHINEYNEAAIQDVEQISGYGLAYTGVGFVGFYKLQVKFGKPMEFVTKIELSSISSVLCRFYIRFFWGNILYCNNIIK